MFQYPSVLSEAPADVNAVLLINLEAISENYKSIRNYVGPARCAAVVKADAYGFGQDRIVATLKNAGCEDFFFAYLQEAIRAQGKNPGVNFYVFNGVGPGAESLFVENGLIPCLISCEQVQRYGRYAARIGKKLPCVIHVDTGMGREGLEPGQVAMLTAEMSDLLEHLDIRYVMSHMANSNLPGNPKNALQFDRFQDACSYFPGVATSLSNSSALFLGPEYHCDLVRPGAALYGYKYCPLPYLHFAPCVSLWARILMTRDLPRGESVGYDGTFVCERDTRLALVALGHADGLLRQASNRAHVYINGIITPIVGRISMDVIMVDITDHQQPVTDQDWAYIYGDYRSVRDFAQAEGTSIYELFVRHSARYHRVYTS